MGGCYQEMRLAGDLDEKAVVDKFLRVQEEDRYENGHSYSGGFGMADGLDFRSDRGGVFHQKTFDTFDMATEWLQEHAQKWEPALAVRAKNGRATLTQTTLKEGELVKTESPNPNFGKEFWIIGAWCSS